MATYLKYSRAKNTEKVSDKRLNMLELESKNIIQEFLSVSNKNIIAFSGGKDSIVASHLASSFGIKDAINDDSFMFTKSKMDVKNISNFFGLNLYIESGLTWDWLKKNQKFCAPPMKIQSQLYAKRQQKTVKGYSKRNGYTGVLYGRRKQENSVKSGLYQIASKQWQCHPLINWTTNDIWSYIYKNNLPFPNLYNHEIGEKEGFTSFLLPPEHFNGNVWKSIYDYEPAIVKRFAEFHIPAQNFLNKIK